jgi:murein DD-endopeptidase MepM/ murein hydrolase activator NlpD
MTRLITAARIRLPGVRLIAVLSAAVYLLLPGWGWAAAVGDTGEAVPSGVWPLQPKPAVVRAFDPPATVWGSGHRGVDLAGRAGQGVRAALGGTVTFAGMLAGRGVVVVDHGDTRTTYEPVEASVSSGDVVAAGAVLGSLTLAASHCLPTVCLHWGWIRNADDVYLDPLALVGLGAPIRLLPLWRATPVTRVPASLTAPAPRTAYAGWRPPVTRWLAP